mgnify:CR=1 FL=1
MSLVTTKDLMLDAQKNHYAIGAFNAENMEMVQAIIAAAEELRAPVIVQTTPGTLKYASPAMFHAMVAAAASEASVPVVMHLDHGSSYELAMQAFRAGYTSVMIDGSHHVFEENIEITKKVVEYLTHHPKVEKVNHPSLPDHPDHALYEKYFPNGGASIFTFNIKGGQKEAFEFIDHLQIFSLLANVADVKSLVIHPATTTHGQLSDAELADVGIGRNTIRLSIGTEHVDDIIADLAQALDAVE